MPELECVALQSLSEESLRSHCTLLPFSGVARGKRMPRRDASELWKGPSETTERTAVTPEAHRAGAVGRGWPSIC